MVTLAHQDVICIEDAFTHVLSKCLDHIIRTWLLLRLLLVSSIFSLHLIISIVHFFNSQLNS